MMLPIILHDPVFQKELYSTTDLKFHHSILQVFLLYGILIKQQVAQITAKEMENEASAKEAAKL